MTAPGGVGAARGDAPTPQDAATLRTFVQSVADHGIHVDTMPTVGGAGNWIELYRWFSRYLDDADQNMRKSARAALAAARPVPVAADVPTPSAATPGKPRCCSHHHYTCSASFDEDPPQRCCQNCPSYPDHPEWAPAP